MPARARQRHSGDAGALDGVGESVFDCVDAGTGALWAGTDDGVGDDDVSEGAAVGVWSGDLRPPGGVLVDLACWVLVELAQPQDVHTGPQCATRRTLRRSTRPSTPHSTLPQASLPGGAFLEWRLARGSLLKISS